MCTQLTAYRALMSLPFLFLYWAHSLQCVDDVFLVCTVGMDLIMVCCCTQFTVADKPEDIKPPEPPATKARTGTSEIPPPTPKLKAQVPLPRAASTEVPVPGGHEADGGPRRDLRGPEPRTCKNCATLLGPLDLVGHACGMFIDQVAGHRKVQDKFVKYKTEVEEIKQMLRDERRLRVVEYNGKLLFRNREKIIEIESGEKVVTAQQQVAQMEKALQEAQYFLQN